MFLDSVLPGEITRRSIIGNMPKTQHDNPIGETQGTSSSQNNSYNVSDTSSVARFPSFSFSLNCLTSLSSVSIPSEGIKVNVLLVVIELDGPDTITIKTGRDQGKQVSVLKILASDDRDNICTVTAWREVAEAWSGAESDVIATKRGDVVFLESQFRAYLLVLHSSSRINRRHAQKTTQHARTHRVSFPQVEIGDLLPYLALCARRYAVETGFEVGGE